jgi:sugar lactone lactonase YvrE
MKTNFQTKIAKNLKVKLMAALVCTVTFAGAQQVSTIAGTTNAGSNDGVSTSAGFNSPFGIANDGQGNLYVADAGNNEIRKISIETGEVTTIAGSVEAGSVNGTDTSARFNYPTGVACDAQGNLYVADSYNNQIRKIVLATGAVTTLAGSGKDGGSDGVGTTASFYHPCGIAADAQGNLYVAGGLNSAIRKIVIATGAVTTIAGSSCTGSADGKGAAASFNYPSGVALDGEGSLYVVDEGNNEIRKIVLATGMVSTIAGCTSWGSANGIGASAKFDAPYGITADGNGDLFVADGDNNEIRKIVIATGTVSTLAGSRSEGANNGTGSLVSFNNPRGIASDVNGNLYVADFGNNEIRIVGNLFTSVNNVTETASVSVYPNPARQNINLNFNIQNSSEHATVRIVDMTGKEVMSIATEVANDKATTVDVNSLTPGVYFAQAIMNDNTTQVARFIKE